MDENYEDEVILLEDKDILRAALRRRHMTQTDISDKLGIVRSAVSMNMTRDRMGLDNFVKMLDVMEYDVYIVDRKTGEAEWCIDVDTCNS